MLYMQMIFVFCHANSSSLIHLIRFFDTYGDASHQVVSKGKSIFFTKDLLSQVPSVFLAFEGLFPFHICWCPNFKGASTVAILRLTAGKIRVRLRYGGGKILSYAKRHHLIKSVLESSLMYSFRVYK